MKFVWIHLALLLSCFVARGQGSLEVTVTGFTNLEGSLYVGLFDQERHFPREAMAGKVVPLVSKSATATFDDLPPGRYAISVFHDKNKNGKLDTNAIGIPKEGFAFGNNAMGMFGPPSFEKASVFIGNSTVKQKIALKNF